MVIGTIPLKNNRIESWIIQIKLQNLKVLKYNLVLANNINEMIENSGNNTDEIASNTLPAVKSPIFIKGCKAIKSIAINRIIIDVNDQAKGFLKNCFLNFIL